MTHGETTEPGDTTDPEDLEDDVGDEENDEDETAEDAAEGKSQKRRKRRGARKERVLHTRVPAVLEEELKRLATNLRVPVSNVVRAILEDAVDAVDTAAERAEGELMSFAGRLARQRGDLRDRVEKKPKKTPKKAEAEPDCPDSSDVLDGVFGYQPLRLATDTECSVCGRVLAAGTDAHRALFDDPGKRAFLGSGCRLLPKGS